jgi:peptidoglycan/LPS O-acetylase OafA/YrhL
MIDAPILESSDEVTRVASSRPPRYYRPELDILRFIAFLGVFLRHSTYSFWPTVSSAGAYGLSLFFLLSAFLITELLQREKAYTGSIALREFYIRRTLRIWPLYYGFLGLSIILGAVLHNYSTGPGYLISFALMVGNIFVARNGPPDGPIGTLWSISVEEQFYLFWPLLNRQCGVRTLRWIALSALPIGSIEVAYLAAHRVSPTVGIWTNSLVEFQFFACGVLLSLWLKGSVPNYSARVRFAFITCGLASLLGAARWTGINNIEPTSAAKLVPGYYLICLGCVALFLGVYGLEQRWIPSPLVYLGRISYGLYVFHKPCLDLASWVLKTGAAAGLKTHHAALGVTHVVLGFLLTLAAASLSYRYFETSFLKLKERFTIIHSRQIT